MILVYLIRHAESTGNAENRMGGLVDFPLSEKGKMQAEQTAEAIATLETTGHRFDKPLTAVPFTTVYTSPLQRARETAEALVRRLKDVQRESFDFVEDERINEIDAGELEGVPFGDLGAYAEVIEGIRYKPEIAFPGGESHANVIRRTESFVRDLLKRHRIRAPEEPIPHETTTVKERVAVFSHGITCNYLLHHLLEIPPEGFQRFPVRKAAISIVELARGFPRLLLYNYLPWRGK